VVVTAAVARPECAPALSLADLEAFDPRPAGAGRERRFGCPLPACRDKPRDRAHQSLSVNPLCQYGGRHRRSVK
jgi:hypothetical protein